MTSVLEAVIPADSHSSRSDTIRIGVLGLGNVGSAFVRLAVAERDRLRARGCSAVTTAALVRSSDKVRPAADGVPCVTTDADAFFSCRLDVVVEVLGGVESSLPLVRRALESGIPVVSAKKSLLAVHGESLRQLARSRGTALRYEASCIAGVPFLGPFERRPLASRVRGLTGILNGTSNAIVSGLDQGATFDAALHDAQRLGLAEPDPSNDVSGRDSAEKLTVLLQQFAHLGVHPDEIPRHGLDIIEPRDLRAARTLGGRLRPVAHAAWTGPNLHAFVGPAFLPDGHPLAALSGAMNGIVLDAAGGSQCFLGPGAGPDVTAATLLDDVFEIATERPVRDPSGHAVRRAAVSAPESAWLLRIAGPTPLPDTSELLGTFGVWCTRLLQLDGWLYALSCPATAARVTAAMGALQAATGRRTQALPALGEEAGAC